MSSILVCVTEEEFTYYYRVPQEKLNPELTATLERLSAENGTSTDDIRELIDTLDSYRLLRNDVQHWVPSNITTNISKVYFVQGWC